MEEYLNFKDMPLFYCCITTAKEFIAAKNLNSSASR